MVQTEQLGPYVNEHPFKNHPFAFGEGQVDIEWNHHGKLVRVVHINTSIDLQFPAPRFYFRSV